MIQLAYVSTATSLFTGAEIADILAVSRENNARDNITGILLYKSGSVIQVLEGDSAKVHRLFEAICRDPRHHHVTLVYQHTIEAREFGEWSMGFRLLDAELPAHPPAAFEIRALIGEKCGEPPGRGKNALVTFDRAFR